LGAVIRKKGRGNMAIPTITIDLDKKCAECRKNGSGVAPNGLCLGCTTKALKGKPMRSAEGQEVAARFNDLKRNQRSNIGTV
jgi:hypothetical protein